FACHRRAIRAELALEILARIEVRESSNPKLVQASLGDFADARHLAHWKAREHLDFVAGLYEQDSIRLGQIGSNLRYNASTADSDGAIQVQFAAHRIVQFVGGLERWSKQARSASHVEVGLIHGSHFHFWRKAAENVVDLARVLAIELHVAIEVNAVWTQLGRRSQRHCRVHAKFPRSIGRSRDYSALILGSAHHYWLVLDGGIKQSCHGN